MLEILWNFITGRSIENNNLYHNKTELVFYCCCKKLPHHSLKQHKFISLHCSRIKIWHGPQWIKIKVVCRAHSSGGSRAKSVGLPSSTSLGFPFSFANGAILHLQSQEWLVESSLVSLWSLLYFPQLWLLPLFYFWDPYDHSGPTWII